MNDHVDIWSRGEVATYLSDLAESGQVRPCMRLRLERGHASAFYPRCTEDWASRQPAHNVTTDVTAYSAPSSYSWPICPKDCPRFSQSPDFINTVSRDQYADHSFGDDEPDGEDALRGRLDTVSTAETSSPEPSNAHEPQNVTTGAGLNSKFSVFGVEIPISKRAGMALIFLIGIGFLWWSWPEIQNRIKFDSLGDAPIEPTVVSQESNQANSIGSDPGENPGAALLESELTETYLAVGRKVWYFNEWARPPTLQALRIVNTDIVATALDGRTVSTSINAELMPIPDYYEEARETLSFLNSEQLRLVNRYFVSYRQYVASLRGLVNSSNNVTGTIIESHQIGIETVNRGFEAICALGLAPPPMFETPELNYMPVICP